MICLPMISRLWNLQYEHMKYASGSLVKLERVGPVVTPISLAEYGWRPRRDLSASCLYIYI